MLSGMRAELAKLGRLCWPVVGSNLLCYLLQLEGQIFVGHLGSAELAAAALGNTYFNLIWYFVLGFSTALDTLASQAYGARDGALVTVWCWRTSLLLTLLWVPSALFMFFARDILVGLFRLPPELSSQAGEFVYYLIPGTLFYSLFMCLQKYQQSQNLMTPSLWVTLAANVVHVGANYALIFTAGLGFRGSPIATSLARLVMLVLQAAHVFCTPPPPMQLLVQDDAAVCTTPPTFRRRRRATQATAEQVFDKNGLWQVTALGLSGGLMMGLEAWMFEAMTIFASHISDVALDAHNVQLVVAGFCFTSFPLGISIASSIRVGNLVGAGTSCAVSPTWVFYNNITTRGDIFVWSVRSGNGPQARLAALTSIAGGVGFMAICGVLMLAFRADIGPIFSGDAAVIALVARLAPIAALFAVADGFQGVCAGVLRGLGKQLLVAKMNFAAFWLVGVPTGYLLCFDTDLGVFGLWWGLCIGLVTLSLLYVFAWFHIDWDEEATSENDKTAARGGERGAATQGDTYGTF